MTSDDFSKVIILTTIGYKIIHGWEKVQCKQTVDRKITLSTDLLSQVIFNFLNFILTVK